MFTSVQKPEGKKRGRRALPRERVEYDLADDQKAMGEAVTGTAEGQGPALLHFLMSWSIRQTRGGSAGQGLRKIHRFSRSLDNHRPNPHAHNTACKIRISLKRFRVRLSIHQRIKVLHSMFEVGRCRSQTVLLQIEDGRAQISEQPLFKATTVQFSDNTARL